MPVVIQVRVLTRKTGVANTVAGSVIWDGTY